MSKVMLTGEVAHLLGVHPISIHRLAASGKLRFTTNANGWKMFDAKDVEALRRDRESKADPKVILRTPVLTGKAGQK